MERSSQGLPVGSTFDDVLVMNGVFVLDGGVDAGVGEAQETSKVVRLRTEMIVLFKQNSFMQECVPLGGATQKIQCCSQYLIGSQLIRINEQVGVFARVGETADLLVIIFLLPIEFASLCADRKRCAQINQDIGFGNDLPHGLHIGMFLGDVAAAIAVSFQAGDQCGFSRTAWTDNANQRLTWRLHY